MTVLASSRGAFLDTFRSLRFRNFRLFFIGQVISQSGTWMTMVAQTLLVLDMTGSGVLLGLLAAAQFGPVLFLGAWAGAVADRSDKHRLLTITQSAAMLQSLALGTVVLAGVESVPIIFVLAGIQGIITAFDNPARRSFVVEMVPRENLANAVSLNSTLMTTSRMIGPALAGVLIVTVGYGWCFLLDGASYLVVLAALRRMRPAEFFAEAPTPRSPGQIRDGLRYVASNSEQLVPLVMMAIVGTFAFNFTVTTPLLVTGPLGGSNQAYTLLVSTMSLGSVTGAIATARRRAIPFSHLIWSAVAFGIAMLALAMAPVLWVAYPIVFAVGLGSIAFMTTSTAMMQLQAEPRYRGRVLALQAMVFLGTTPIGSPLVGWMSDRFGPRTAIGFGAVACFVAAWFGARRLTGRGPSSLDADPVPIVERPVA
ncbi:MAG TPA: MFS transporter [Acidimicrobiia bacterium]|nr:MFS transporter [Acidimicrobiia bacterium]